MNNKTSKRKWKNFRKWERERERDQNVKDSQSDILFLEFDISSHSQIQQKLILSTCSVEKRDSTNTRRPKRTRTISRGQPRFPYIWACSGTKTQMKSHRNSENKQTWTERKRNIRERNNRHKNTHKQWIHSETKKREWHRDKKKKIKVWTTYLCRSKRQDISTLKI